MFLRLMYNSCVAAFPVIVGTSLVRFWTGASLMIDGMVGAMINKSFLSLVPCLVCLFGFGSLGDQIKRAAVSRRYSIFSEFISWLCLSSVGCLRIRRRLHL